MSAKILPFPVKTFQPVDSLDFTGLTMITIYDDKLDITFDMAFDSTEDLKKWIDNSDYELTEVVDE